jgi:hypothetical protein
LCAGARTAPGQAMLRRLRRRRARATGRLGPRRPSSHEAACPLQVRACPFLDPCVAHGQRRRRLCFAPLPSWKRVGESHNECESASASASSNLSWAHRTTMSLWEVVTASSQPASSLVKFSEFGVRTSALMWPQAPQQQHGPAVGRPQRRLQMCADCQTRMQAPPVCSMLWAHRSLRAPGCPVQPPSGGRWPCRTCP